MYLPTVQLDPVFGLDASPNQTPITQFGVGVFEKLDVNNDGDYSRLTTTGSCGYLIDLPKPLGTRNFTYEWSGKPSTTSWVNYIFATLDYLNENVNNQIALSVSSTTIYLHRTVSNSIYSLAEWIIPVNQRAGDFKITFIRDYPNYKVYFGDQLVINVSFTAAQNHANVLLFAAVGGGDINRMRYSYRGVVNYARYHDGLVLPQKFWYNPRTTSLPRDTQLSQVPNQTELSIDNIGRPALVDAEVVGDYMLFLFNDSTIRVSYRPRGTDVGVTITSAKLNASDELIVGFSDGQTFNLGVNNGSDPGSQWPESINNGGYLLEVGGTKKFVPIVPQGDTIFTVTPSSAILTLPTVDTKPLSAAEYVEIYTPLFGGVTQYQPNTAGQFATMEFTTEFTAAGLEVVKSGNGRPIIPAGKYYVSGYVPIMSADTVVARLTGKVSGTILVSSNFAYAKTQSSPGDAASQVELRFNDVVTLTSDTEVGLEFNASANLKYPVSTITQSFGIGASARIRFYRIG